MGRINAVDKNQLAGTEPCQRKLSLCGSFPITSAVAFHLVDHRPAAAAEQGPWSLHELTQRNLGFNMEVQCLAAFENAVLAGTWQGVVAVDRIEPRYSGLGSAPDFEFKGMRAAVDSIALWRGWMVVGAEGRIGVWQKVPQTILESTFNAHT